LQLHITTEWGHVQISTKYRIFPNEPPFSFFNLGPLIAEVVEEHNDNIWLSLLQNIKMPHSTDQKIGLFLKKHFELIFEVHSNSSETKIGLTILFKFT